MVDVELEVDPSEYVCEFLEHIFFCECFEVKVHHNMLFEIVVILCVRVRSGIMRARRYAARCRRAKLAERQRVYDRHCARLRVRTHDFGPWMARRRTSLGLRPFAKGEALDKYFQVWGAAQRPGGKIRYNRPWVPAARRAGLNIAYLHHLECCDWRGEWKMVQKIRRRVRGALELLKNCA